MADERSPEQKAKDLRDALRAVENKTLDGIPWYQAEALAVALSQAKADLAKANESWRCFHCGEVFSEESDARIHFGVIETLEPLCVDKVTKDEALRMTVVRKLEADIRRLMKENEELDHQAGGFVGMQIELARYFGTCGGSPVKTASQAWLVHEAVIGRAEAAEARAERAEADVEALRRGECRCWKEPGATEEAHETHCPKMASMLHRGYCDRIKGLLKFEALAEERGRVIESAILVLGSCQLYGKLLDVMTILRKALTPEPAKEDGNNG